MIGKAFRIFRIALLAVCIAVFLVSAVMLVRILVEYSKAENVYDEINKGIENIDSDSEVKDVPENLVALSKYVSELKAQYPDVVGYVNVPSLGISYPVVQTDNNDYYLDHMINGEESTSGAIFLDYRINSNPAVSKNTVLYGHNMNNGSMFHKVVDLFTLEKFLEAEVEYVTENSAYVYTPLALYRCEAYYPFYMYEFDSDGGFLDFCDMITEKSFHTERPEAEYGADARLITFSTCTNSISSKTGRYIYHAVLTEFYENIHTEAVE